MVKPLSFKGEKRPKKRKAQHIEQDTALQSQDQEHGGETEDESWVTAEAANDVAGPVILVVPSTKPSCVACDAIGKVFTSEIENLVDGNPSTAEPHDVRQVWIANRVAGTEEINLKGHHGRYMSCDKIGLVSATTDAVSPEESFLCIPSPDTPGTFSLQTVREKFLALTDSKVPEIRGDADSISFNTTFRIRMQARFKPRLRANKEAKKQEKISRKELEEAAGRRLEDEEVKRLKKARVEGDYHEAMLDLRAKGKHDKYS